MDSTVTETAAQLTLSLFDYIVIGLAIFLLIRGIFKGFLEQLFGVVGVTVITMATAKLYAYPMKWMEKLVANESTRQVVALIATGALLFLLYKLITRLIVKLITKNKTLGFANRLIGGLLGVAIIYAAMAVVVAVLTSESDIILFKALKEMFAGLLDDSWIVAHVYKNNFFGDWIINMISNVFKGLVSA